jgi:hypothetical protein
MPGWVVFGGLGLVLVLSGFGIVVLSVTAMLIRARA